MSGRTMPLSSRVDMVLCTSEWKKFTTELDMNLMCSNCVHETENKYCKQHNILNANSCLCYTHIYQELVNCPVFKKACFSKECVFLCFLLFRDWLQAHCYILVLLQIKQSSSNCLFVKSQFWNMQFEILTVQLQIVTAMKMKNFLC